MSSEFWAAITGAIVGAVGGGIISFILQHISLREAREQREKVESDRKKALGYSLLVKVIKTHTKLFHLHAEQVRTQS